MSEETVDCLHGKFTIRGDDEFVGASLKLYGEYSEHEAQVFRQCIVPGDVVLDVGANIGAFTVVLSKIVGPEGEVYAFEPGRENFRLLHQNLYQNYCLHNVTVYNAGCSSTHGRAPFSAYDALGHKNFGAMEVGKGEEVCELMPIDQLELEKCKFMKIDVEGYELEALKGARATIDRCRPILYIENDRVEKSEALIAYLVEELGYRCFWHRPWMFHIDNFRGNKRNIFGNIVSINMLCVHEDSKIELHGLDEVADLRMDERLYEREAERMEKRAERNNDLMTRMLAAHYRNLMQDTERADALVDKNLEQEPEHGASIAIKGLWALQRGQWKEGWSAYELRFSQCNPRQFGGHREFGVPKWEGQRLVNDSQWPERHQTLLISSEQGFGDTVMFARFVHDALERVRNIVLEVQPQLYELFEHSGFMDIVDLVRLGRSLPHYDYQCALPSLPHILGADDSMIRVPGPYLHADYMAVLNWKGEGNLTKGTVPLCGKIGICSKGSPRSERPFTRDLPDEMVHRLGKVHGPFFNLNQDGQFESFADTAAAIMALDLVLTVDTSVAHLAGALGKPVWLLLSFDPDWRWGLKGTRSIWYPSMRIFRQPKLLDWGSVVDDVLKALADNRTEMAA